MSKSELKEEKRKRKRQEDGAEEAPKKSKKSKKSKNVSDDPTEEAPAVPDKKREKKEEKEKKDRKEKKQKGKKSKEPGSNDEHAPDPANGFSEQNGTAKDTVLNQDFIRFDDVPMPGDKTDSNPKKNKKEKKDKKDKKSKEAENKKMIETTEDVAAAEPNGTTEESTLNAEPVVVEEKSFKKKQKKDKEGKKEKKEKKHKQSSKTVEAEPEASDEAAEATKPLAAGTNGAEVSEEQNGDEIVEEDGTSDKKGRFIVFVGSLPYSATKEQLDAHFAKVKPKEIRMRTYKGTNKFMGTAFVEFDNFDRMETCLKKYHHSIFPDSKKKEGRKINVELSAGGGGNSDTRKARIMAKNEKLSDERQRDREKRNEIENKQKERKEKKDAKLNSKAGEGAVPEEEANNNEHGGMHPARLAMMQMQGGGRGRKKF